MFCVTNDLSYDQRMQRICGTLVNAGYHVELIGRLLPHSKPIDPTFTFKTTRLKCQFNKGKLFYIEYNIRLLFYLIKQQFDAICAIDFDTLLAANWASSLHNKPLIFDAHEYFTEVPEVTNRPITKWVWHTIGKQIVPQASLCYTVGPQLASILSAAYQNTFKVIMNVPWPIDSTNKNTPSDQTNSKTKIILYQGALNAARGLEESIMAMHQITNAHLYIAGEGDLSEFLRNLVIKENLSDKVFFLGYLNPTELKELTQKAFIGLNLLQANGQSYYYSLANKYFDYMQAGVPCICVNFPEYEFINNKYNCSVLIPCEINSIVEASNHLLNNETAYELLSNNCLLAAKDYNWSIEEAKLIKYYHELFI